MIFFGALAALLCVFGLGTLWRSSVPLDPAQTLWGFFVKALFVAWFWFCLSYYSNFGMAAKPLTVILAMAVAIGLARAPLTTHADYPTGRMSGVRVLLASAAFLIVAAPALMSFGSIFEQWDAVASWNRWGIELSRNSYAPLNAAYPILWPGIWSLIYEAQGTTDLWFIPKASIVAPLTFLALYAAYQVIRNNSVSGLLLCLLVYAIFVTQKLYIVSGYMDLPLSFIGLGALLVMRDALDATLPERRRALLTIAAVTCAVSVVTKQGGIVFCGLFGTLCLYSWAKGQIRFVDGLKYLAIIVTPLAFFLKIFLDTGRTIFGNYSELQEVAGRSRGAGGIISHAFDVISAGMPSYALIIIAIGIVLNLVFFRSSKSVFGLAALGLGGILFYFYANCCTYNIRNAYVIFSFLIFSAFTGFSEAETVIRTRLAGIRPARQNQLATNGGALSLRMPILTFLGTAVLSTVALTIAMPEKALRDVHTKKLTFDLFNRQTNQFLYGFRSEIGESRYVMTFYQMMKFMPYTKDRYYYCPTFRLSCVDGAFSPKNANQVLYFTNGYTENPTSRMTMQQLVDAKVMIRISDEAAVPRQMFRIERDMWLSWRRDNPQ